MKTLFRGLFCLVVLAALSAAPPVLAQTSVQPVVIARVNIQNCIYAQEGRELKITCDFINNGAIQPDVRYAIQLTKKLGDRQVIVDHHIFPETLALAANSRRSQNISYTIPGYAHGELQVSVAARNTEGLPLAQNVLGFVTAEVLPGHAEIVADSCFLEIPGEAKSVRYSPQQGVDVSTDEPLVAHCSVTNLGDAPLTLAPSSATTWRSLYGSRVEVPEFSYPSLELAARETKEYVFTIPKPSAPQSYDTTLHFTSGGKQVTNAVAFHYVIQGASGTIQNISLDKAKYEAGETAVVTTSWTGSADNFPESRSGGTRSGAQRVHVKIMANESLCGEGTKDTEMTEAFKQVSLEIPITQKCKNPSVIVEVMDEKGIVLASKTSDIPSSLGQPPFYKTNMFYALAGIVGLLLTVAAGVLLYRRTKRRNDMTPPPSASILPLLLLFPLLAGTIFFGGSAPLAHADTFGGSGWFSQISGGSYVFSVNINKSQPYSPNESIGVTMDVSYPACMNGGGAFSISATNVPNGQNYSYSSAGGTTCTDTTGLGLCEVFLPSYASLSTTFTAPSAAGNYFIHFIGGDAAYPGPNGTSWPYDLPYSVAVPASAPTVDLKFNGSDSASINANAVGTLSWTTTNTPTSCNASFNWSGSKNPAGGSEGNINVGTSNKTYTITCSNSAGSATDTVNVTVVSAPTCDLTVNGLQGPTTVPPNSSVNIAWTMGGGVASSCTASGSWTGSKGASGGSQSLNVGTTNKTYSLSCTNTAGTCSDSVTVNVGSGPTVDIKANGSDGPIDVAANSSVPLTWTTTGSPSSCTATGSWSGSKGTAASNGPESQNAGTSQKTYTITCTKAGYTSAVDSVVVNVFTNGICGDRNTSYPSTTTNWPAGSTYCSAGTNSSSPSFPSAGSSVSWTCQGSGSGSTNATCTASRGAAVLNGICSTTTNNACVQGTSSDIADTSTNYLWNCNGLNGGTNASCSLAKPATPAPDLTAGGISPTTATPGTAITLSATISNVGNASTGASFTSLFQRATNSSGSGATDIGTDYNAALPAGWSNTTTLSYTFSSAGTYYVRACADKSSASNNGVITESNENNNCGPWTAIIVTAPETVVNGQCGATNNSCTAGTLNDTADTGSNYEWGCLGSNGGTDASCSVSKGGLLSCYPSPTNNTVGYQTTWSIGYTYGITYTSYSWSGTDGLSGSSSSVNKTYSTTGTKTATLTATSANGTETASCTTEISEQPVQPPDLQAGAHTPSTATQGTPVTLSAYITNWGESAAGSGFPNLFQRSNYSTGTGAIDIGTYTATTWFGGADIDAGIWTSENATLSYTFTSSGTFYIRVCADKASASGGGIVVESNEYNNCGPWRSITVAATPKVFSCSVSETALPETGGTTTYTATMTGGNGSGIGYHSYDRYTWDPSDGDPYPITSQDTLARIFTSAHAGNSYGMSVTLTNSIYDSTTYTAQCPLVQVGSVCVGSPTGTVTASPARVREGDSTTITVSNVQNARTSCTLSGPGINKTYSASSCVASGGTVNTPAMYTQGTYILTCDGAEVDRVIINILPNFKEF